MTEPYIWDCFAYVSLCDMVIAVDSAILHKPTLVLLGDYEDAGRDIFINPYTEISTIKFTNLSSVLPDTLHKAKELLDQIVRKTVAIH